MLNLLKMDLYRLTKTRAFYVTLGLAALTALLSAPFDWLLYSLVNLFSKDVEPFEKTAQISGYIASPLPLLNAMLALLCAVSFFNADIEFGYIKNIAGQMPKKGYTILSKFCAAAAMNLVFMLAGTVFSLIGALFIYRLTAGNVLDSLLVFLLKFLLLQGCTAILLLFVSALKSKSAGSVFAVLLGARLLGLVYLGIDLGLSRVFKNISFSVSDYMPDQLLGLARPDTLTALIVSLVTMGLFLGLSILIFDRRDVK